MKLRLRIKVGDESPRFVDLDETTALRLGREDDNDVVLEDGQVSKYHAIIRPSAHGHVLVDGGSRNGIWVGEVALHADVERLLVPGAFIRMGKSVRIDVLDRPMTATGSTAELALRMVDNLRPKPMIVVVEGPNIGKAIALDQGATVVIGRGSDVALSLTDAKVSTKHLEVLREAGEGGTIALRDLGSRHGTIAGTAVCEPNHPYVWLAIRQIEIGSSVLALVPKGEIPPPSHRAPSAPVAASKVEAAAPPADAIAAPAPALPAAASPAESSPIASSPRPSKREGAAPIAEVPKMVGEKSTAPKRPFPVVQVLLVLVIVVCLAGLVWVLLTGK